MHDIARRAIETDDPIPELVAAFYAEGGPLAENGWELRDQQITMSGLIADTMGTKRWGLVEAPTGCGKGLAYLVPGVLAVLRAHAKHAVRVAKIKARKERGEDVNGAGDPPKLVISTANIALQEQLIKKDIPAMSALLDVNLKAVLLKSVGNYVCRKSVSLLGGQWLTDGRTGRLLREMKAEGFSGDREAFDWDPGELWPQVSRNSSDCTGRACAHYSQAGDASHCFWRRAVRGKAPAHILVMNHHYLAMAKAPKNVLLAIDEAHELESALRSTRTKKLTPFSGHGVANKAKRWLGADEAQAGIKDPVDAIMEDLHNHYRSRIHRGTDAAVLQPGWGSDHTKALDALVSVAHEVMSLCSGLGCFLSPRGPVPPFGDGQDIEEAAALCSLWRAVVGLYERCWTVVHVEPYQGDAGMREMWPGTPWAIYAEADQRGRVYAHMAPADVSWATHDMYGKYPNAVLTSATLSDFRGLRLTLGMAGPGVKVEEGDDCIHGPAYERRLPSPFPLATMGALVVPNGPGPKDRAWSGWACEQVVEAVQHARGRTLVLCTSYRQMMAYTEALRADGGAWPVKRQNEEGRGQLRAWFRDNTDSVLVASRSFFQGLDVQGESLSCVVIDRIPFSRPGDPVEDAVQQLLVDRNGGGNGFMLRSVPQASMTLAQGAGRLIRSMEDRGCVVMLDNRIVKRSGCWPLLKAGLPPFPVSRDITDVGNVLDGKELVGKVQQRKTTGRSLAGRRRGRW